MAHENHHVLCFDMMRKYTLFLILLLKAVFYFFQGDVVHLWIFVLEFYHANKGDIKVASFLDYQWRMIN
ncbi:hypothetical protein L1887_20428 [Cichorium endivia]|nr:hypothetical protein L1887_20428 [Cichorium endivia]